MRLPHTWNASDVMDDEPGYYRGDGWYKRSFTVDASMRQKKIYLYYEGANQVSTVWINGKLAGNHTGGYTGFYVPLNEWLRYDAPNEIVVSVNNSYQEDIAPLTADFTFYGGIYRDVWLVTTDAVHFTISEHGAKGLFITTPQVNAEQARVLVHGSVNNETIQVRSLRVITRLRDQQGKLMQELVAPVSIPAQSAAEFTQQSQPITKPHLWSPEHPYLYTAETDIIDATTGRLLDRQTNKVGFRWFHFDADKGFFLNGQPYKLVGSSRHQDYQGLGNAVPNALARKDVQWLKEMGGNFLRIAHYPQDPVILEACDELGILTSVEIPVVNEITESEAFTQNCLRMQQEMIRQNFNHPSIIIWCYMNEVLLRPHFNNDKPRQEIYFARVAELARQLDSTTRHEDPTRYTMLVNHGDFNRYKAVGLTAIPQLVGWNLYSGWYGGNLSDFPAFLDRHHKELPDKPLLVTEYGADADPRIRSMQPVKFDKSVEYTTAFHQYYLSAMMERPFVAGAMLWNLADFNSEGREETMPHINNKGLLMWNRTPKDPYYFYQASLRKEPVLKILGAYWKQRGGMADSNAPVCTQPVQVASNLAAAELFLNGKSLGKQSVKAALASWSVPFVQGANKLTVQGISGGRTITDQLTIDFQLQPDRLQRTDIPFRQVNLLLGANRYYIDSARQLWIPDQPYRSGSWGHVGGKVFKIPGNNRLPYGTDKNIVGTDNDPIYQTQHTGLTQYRFDVPAGQYELTLHFAELLGGTVKGIPYNLSSEGRKEDEVLRSFDVLANGQVLLNGFDIGRQYGVARAVAKRFTVTVSGQQGLVLDFKPVTGEPVLNAIQLKKQ